MKLGILSFDDETRYRQLRQLVTNLGHQILEVYEPDTSGDVEANRAGWMKAWADARELVEEADALYLPSFIPFTEPTLLDRIHARVRDGARVLVSGSSTHLDEQNRFLAFYGMSFTDIVLHSEFPSVAVHRCAHSFRDSVLFAGVECVYVNRPTLVVPRAEALPVLVAEGDEFLVDPTTDLPWNHAGRDLVVFAAWHGPDGGAVLATGGSMLGDPYTGPTGMFFPGLPENRQFASNLVTFLLGSGTARSQSAPTQ